MIALALCAALLAGPAAPAPQTMTPHAAAAQPDAELRDIRGPIHLPDWLRFLPWLGGAAIAAVAAGLLLRKRAKRARTPSERALERLEQIWPLAQAGEPRDYPNRASDVLREYIEEAFPLRAMHRTTEEFLAEVAADRASPLGAQRETLAQVLELCDLAKFARCALPAEALTHLHETARGFVLATRAPSPERSAA